MSLPSPPPAVYLLCSSSHSSSSSFSPFLRFQSGRNAAAIDCCINGGRILLSARGNKRLLPLRPFSSPALDVSTVDDPHSLTTSSVSAQPLLPLSRWNLGSRHILLLSIISCTVAVSTSWLFLSAIPTLLAFRKAAESLEKLFDVTREELPDTMAAMRLSGMEISDLTMELSDLGREITQGVRSSTRAVRAAEERLRHLTAMDPTGTQQFKRSGETTVS